jgi:phage gpG-like protein
MSEIQFSFENSAEAKLTRLLNAAQDLTAASERALDEAAASILANLKAGFLAERNPEGDPWIPSRAGIARKERGGTGTLFNTGRLFHSIQLYKTGPGERVIGTDVPYAVKHQLGDGVIKREFMYPSDQQVQTAQAIYLFRMKELSNG